MRITKCWNKDVVPSLSMEVFKTQLDKVLGSMVMSFWWPSLQEKVGLETFWGPFQPELSGDPVFPTTHSSAVQLPYRMLQTLNVKYRLKKLDRVTKRKSTEYTESVWTPNTWRLGSVKINIVSLLYSSLNSSLWPSSEMFYWARWTGCPSLKPLQLFLCSYFYKIHHQHDLLFQT